MSISLLLILVIFSPFLCKFPLKNCSYSQMSQKLKSCTVKPPNPRQLSHLLLKYFHFFFILLHFYHNCCYLLLFFFFIVVNIFHNVKLSIIICCHIYDIIVHFESKMHNVRSHLYFFSFSIHITRKQAGWQPKTFYSLTPVVVFQNQLEV